MRTRRCGWPSRRPARRTCPKTISTAPSSEPRAQAMPTTLTRFPTRDMAQVASRLSFALTDNRNRTVGEVRSALTRAGGTLGENGSVAWMFDNVGLISVDANGGDPEEIALVAIDAGADDVSIDEDGIEVYTAVQSLHTVQEALVAAGITVNSADPVMKPKATVTPDTASAIKVIKLLEKLEDLDDVQTVYSNLEFTDELLAEAS
ncbi:MAG: YebC/PmpR family DNA-binding transcriptional regulator [Thermomicrobiales bacterium]